MELETYVLETSNEMDLGAAQQAYDNYPEAEEAYKQKLREYNLLIQELKSAKTDAITTRQMEKIDSLYEEAKRLQQQFLEIKAVLARKTEALVLESKGLEADLAYHARNFEDEDLNWARTLLSQALEMKAGDELTVALGKAFQAKECLEQLLVQAKNGWLQKHRQNMDKLSADEEL